jgi:hypothetical protein
MSSYDLDNFGLLSAIQQLQRLETAPGTWGLGGTALPFGNELQSRFPLGGRFINDQGQPAISHLQPEQVANVFESSQG